MQYSSTPQDGLVLCEGDANEWSVSITKVTFERLRKEENFPDLLALWMFYAYTCRWQNTNRAYATSSYVMEAMGWGDIKFHRAKNALLKMGLIQDIRGTDESGKVTHWYVKIFYLAKMDNSTPPEITGGGSAEGVGNVGHILKNSQFKYSRTNTPLTPKGEWEEEAKEQEISPPSTTTAPEPSPPLARTPLPWEPNAEQSRINSWFGRRSSTRWNDKELRAYKKLPETTEEEWEMLGEYTMTHEWGRRDPLTLMNNWQGDIDRARRWFNERTVASSPDKNPLYGDMTR